MLFTPAIMLRILLLTLISIPVACNLHGQQPAPGAKRKFVGSAACKPCHEATYDGWRQTRMANVVRDPKLHPDAVLGDFNHPDPVRSFTLDQVAFVYGSRWKQRYFEKRGSDYFPLPAQWDIQHRMWLPYHVADGTDWWTPYYGKANTDRPTGPTCDGCHSVNYNLATRQVTEWNVGCEKCHGPGSEHVTHPTKQNIVNPGDLDYVRGNDVCMQCHTQGRPNTLPVAILSRAGTEGSVHERREYVDWPVGYLPGARLADVWHLEEAKPGTQDFYYFPDDSAHKNRMQGNDFVQSNMYHRGLRCFDCHQVHSNRNPSNLIESGNQLCLNCHTKDNPAGLKGTVSEHTHHPEGSPGSQCTACHMPKIAQTLGNKQDGDIFVSSHTFRFLSPTLTETSGVPNPCIACHKDKTNAWAAAQVRSWTSESPWRVAN
jgi:predicted CXXCH cytochrome family protein